MCAFNDAILFDYVKMKAHTFIVVINFNEGETT